MSSPAVLLTAITTGLHILIVYSDPVPEIDFRTILALAQQEALQSSAPVTDTKYLSNPKEDYENLYGSLSSHEILNLINKSTATQGLGKHSGKSDKESGYSHYVNRQKIKQREEADTYGHYDRYEALNENKIDDYYSYEPSVQHGDKYTDNDERHKHGRFNELALEELLTQNVFGKKYQDKPRKTVKPHDLVGSSDFHYDRSGSSNADRYSKVYVVLNPKAVEKSQNRDEFNNLLVKILSLTASSLEKGQGKRIKEPIYKGFPVKTGLLTRRARRESREMYMGKDSMEDDYKPKRSRNDRGGGGGGPGGRTAIPYIRHRGDIYERDN